MPLVKPTLIFISMMACLCLQAQFVPFEKYTSKNGLVSDRITAIAQDQKGFMWFGSYFGISRYDGIKFKKIILPPLQQNKYVTFITPAAGKLYAGFLFNGGLAVFDSNGKTQSYFIPGKISNEFTALCDNNDGSVILSNSTNELYQFKEGHFRLLLSLPQKNGLYPKLIQKDRWNNLWIGTDDGLYISSFPYQHCTKFFHGENIVSLVKDSENQIWMLKTGKQKTLEKFDGYNGNFINRQKLNIVNPVEVPFYGNTHSGYWLLDYVKGLVNVNTNSGYRISVNFNTDISTVFCDRENNIWIANEPGVVKISNLNIRSWLFDEMATGGGSLLLQNDSSLLASNSRSIYFITHSIKKAKTLPHSSLFGTLLRDPENYTWIGLWDGGLWRMKTNNGQLEGKKFFSTFHHQQIKAQAIVSDKQGNLWVGGLNGIFHFKNGKPVDVFHPLNSTGSPAFITALALDESNKTLWIGDNTSGITKLHYSIHNETCLYTTKAFVTNKDGLKDMYVRSLALDKKNNLWVGTRYGGIFYLQEKNNIPSVTDFTRIANLTCTRISDINTSDSSTVWFAACDGIYSYSYKQNQWKHFTTADGLLNAEIFNVLADKAHNCVWALSSQGVTCIQLQPQNNSVLPEISLTSVNVMGKTDSAALSPGIQRKYSNSQNSIAFTFIAPSFIDEKKVVYRYRLLGYDKDWSEPVASNSVNYASLPPGNYTFEVIAANSRGQWSSKPATFRFQVIMPFYKRSWFIFLVLLFFSSLIYFVRLQQLRHRFKIEKLRLSIARDLHDDVGATLGSINILSKTASRKLRNNPQPAEINSIFQKIGHSAENTLEAMDDIVWAINPSKDKLQDLVVRMREYAIPLLEAKNIDFSFNSDANPDETLAMNVRRNLFLLFKESIHNILKHADANLVSISLSIKNQQLLFSISDNGQGFNTEMTTNRNGLRNMRQRAEVINAFLEIRSSELGTEVVLKTPLR